MKISNIVDKLLFGIAVVSFGALIIISGMTVYEAYKFHRAVEEFHQTVMRLVK